MYKILVADDEKDVVSLLKDYFVMNNYQMLTAYTGTEAVEKVSQNPDIILSFSIEELRARVAAHIRRDHRVKARANVRFFGSIAIYRFCQCGKISLFPQSSPRRLLMRNMWKD